MKEYDIYTGTIKYKEIDFAFVFDKNKLKLIPPSDKFYEVEHWFLKEIKAGVYTIGDPVYIKEILFGISNETGQKITFFPSYNSIVRINSTLVININYYIINKYNRDKIDRVAIKGPEITHIFPTTIALNKFDWGEDGKIGISTKPFAETTTEKEQFNMNEKDISVYFGVSISSNNKTGEAPINLSSTLFVEFEPTADNKFIIDLMEVLKKFVQYLCYRRNIVFSSMELASPTAKGLHETYAILYNVDETNEIENYPIEKDRLIKYKYLKGSIGKILNDIVSNKIYIEHLPETYKIGRHINAGRFVMITAAFEWEFKRNYPKGINKSLKTIEAEKKVTKCITRSINRNKGKTRDIFKFLEKLISTDNFESRIIRYGKDYGNVSDIFGNHLYNFNAEKLDYSKMGKRLADQRNHFAHGDIDKKFIGLSLLDLVYLEYAIYIIQLKKYDIPEENIKFIINDLFACNIAL